MLSEPLHGVTVSVGCDDYLDVSLTHNRPLLSTCVVVTTPEDTRTQQVAGKHGCTLLITADGYHGHRGDRDRHFNKGAMVERGLQQLPQNGWRVHFDADVIMPASTLNVLGTALYDPQALYGADRMNVVGEAAWEKLLATGWASRGWAAQHFLCYPINRNEIGSRLVYGEQGYVPIGYWQCWHSSSEYSGIYRTRGYPTGSNSAAHDDVQFALRWDRSKRILIPELLLAHLVTEDQSYGKNWHGRKSRRWGNNPALLPPAPAPSYVTV